MSIPIFSSVRKKIEKNFWDMEIIGNRRKMQFPFLQKKLWHWFRFPLPIPNFDPTLLRSSLWVNFMDHGLSWPEKPHIKIFLRRSQKIVELKIKYSVHIQRRPCLSGGSNMQLRNRSCLKTSPCQNGSIRDRQNLANLQWGN